jgi:ketopantoate reductase
MSRPFASVAIIGAGALGAVYGSKLYGVTTENGINNTLTSLI